MAEWAVYFHLLTAESYTTEQDSLKAAEHADAAAELAQQQGLLEQQVTNGRHLQQLLHGRQQIACMPICSAAVSGAPCRIAICSSANIHSCNVTTPFLQNAKRRCHMPRSL
jgi:hypothetical protein